MEEGEDKGVWREDNERKGGGGGRRRRSDEKGWRWRRREEKGRLKSHSFMFIMTLMIME